MLPPLFAAVCPGSPGVVIALARKGINGNSVPISIVWSSRELTRTRGNIWAARQRYKCGQFGGPAAYPGQGRIYDAWRPPSAAERRGKWVSFLGGRLAGEVMMTGSHKGSVRGAPILIVTLGGLRAMSL